MCRLKSAKQDPKPSKDVRGSIDASSFLFFCEKGVENKYRRQTKEQ
ncbi:hypothetical protein DB29_03514 [Shouchella clausii]|nr:hypothetical protein DB29_03514 [Shouchella clausii]